MIVLNRERVRGRFPMEGRLQLWNPQGQNVLGVMGKTGR